MLLEVFILFGLPEKTCCASKTIIDIIIAIGDLDGIEGFCVRMIYVEGGGGRELGIKRGGDGYIRKGEPKIDR